MRRSSRYVPKCLMFSYFLQSKLIWIISLTLAVVSIENKLEFFSFDVASSDGGVIHYNFTYTLDTPDWYSELQELCITNQLSNVNCNQLVDFVQKYSDIKKRTPEKSCPYFIIIGAQKAGTTSVVKNLNKHPNISIFNELHYFDLNWDLKPAKWYHDLFLYHTILNDPSKSLLGEKTPSYIYMPECLPRIKSMCPHTKFLLFLRNPITRAYSNWNMNVMKRIETRSFENAVHDNIDNIEEEINFINAQFHYIQRGVYMEQIDYFLSIFPDPSQLLIIVAEQLSHSPVEYYRQMYDFLNIPNVSPDDVVYENDLVGVYTSALSSETKAYLHEFYRPFNERLFVWMNRSIAEWR